MISQSKRLSLLEVVLNVGTGFLLAMGVWQFIVPTFYPHLTPTISENLYMTTVFTAVSVARGYIWRRLFNGNFPEVAMNFIRRLPS